jgi:hypothetical protein
MILHDEIFFDFWKSLNVLIEKIIKIYNPLSPEV